MVAGLRPRDVSHGATVEDEVEQEADEEEVEQGSLSDGGTSRGEWLFTCFRARSRAYNNCHEKDSGEVVEESLVVEGISSLQYDPVYIGDRIYAY